jgi:capsid protein
MLASDLEGVNYSSLRGGLLDERETWMMLQSWFIDTVITPVFEAWLEMALLSGQLGKLPMYRFDKFNAPEWKGRRWAWVDPEKDVNSSIKAVANGFKSRRELIAEQGGDVEETFRDIAADNQLAALAGINIDSDNLRLAADAYGVAARAGVVTPNAEDEKFFRQKLQLPKMPKEVEQSWQDEGGTRRPVTLAVDEQPPPEPAASEE